MSTHLVFENAVRRPGQQATILLLDMRGHISTKKFGMPELDQNQVYGIAAQILFSNSQHQLFGGIRPHDIDNIAGVRRNPFRAMLEADLKALLGMATRNLTIRHQEGLDALWYEVRPNVYMPVFYAAWMAPATLRQVQANNIREDHYRMALTMHARNVQIGNGLVVVDADEGVARYIEPISLCGPHKIGSPSDQALLNDTYRTSHAMVQALGGPSNAFGALVLSYGLDFGSFVLDPGMYKDMLTIRVNHEKMRKAFASLLSGDTIIHRLAQQ